MSRFTLYLTLGPFLVYPHYRISVRNTLHSFHANSQPNSYSHSLPALDLATLHSTLFLYFVSQLPEIALKLGRKPSAALAKSALRSMVLPLGSRDSTPNLTPLRLYRAYGDRVQL